MPERWLIRLVGRSVDLERLHALFGAGGARVERDEDGFALTADEFTGVSDGSTVMGRAKELLLSMTGIAQLNARDMESVRTDAVVLVLPDGSRRHHVFLEAHIKLSADVSAAVGIVGGSAGPPPPPVEQTWLATASQNPAVAEAIALFSGEKNWGTLYKVFELIQGDAPDDLINWGSKAERERFNATANHQSLSGRAARHATQKGTPKMSPLSIEEGSEFIGRLLRRWLDSR